MRKDIPQSGWVDFLMRFAKENEGKRVKLTVQTPQEGEKLLSKQPLVAFEGDCSGDIVQGVKIVTGEEGDNPDNLFHYIESPQEIQSIEDDDGRLMGAVISARDQTSIVELAA
ncbi:MAG: DUF5335 family protein [Patescibacteria group bacterium]|jgi:hypothetical protein